MDLATGLTSHAPLEIAVRVLLIMSSYIEVNRHGRVVETVQQRRERVTEVG